MGQDGFDDFEWSEEKRESNLIKHGVDFEDAKLVFDDIYVTFEDQRRDYNERRYITVGTVEGVTLRVTWTPRESNRRLISAWRTGEAGKQIYDDLRQNEVDRES